MHMNKPHSRKRSKRSNCCRLLLRDQPTHHSQERPKTLLPDLSLDLGCTAPWPFPWTWDARMMSTGPHSAPGLPNIAAKLCLARLTCSNGLFLLCNNQSVPTIILMIGYIHVEPLEGVLPQAIQYMAFEVEIQSHAMTKTIYSVTSQEICSDCSTMGTPKHFT